ncbi:MAG: VPS10 domain-containing protein, partial [Acidobacteriota bacterium]
MRTRLTVALLLLASPLFAQSTPSLDDIIAGYLKTSGGAERIRAVQTLRRTGKLIGGGGFEAAYRQENKRPDKVREEITLLGLTGVNAYNGSSGWKIEPWGGKKDPEALGEDELKSIVDDAAFDDPLFDYKTKGNVVELIGTDEIEGTPVYKVRATLKSNGDVRTYYLDADSYVPIRIDVKRTVRGEERNFEITLGDYKPVNGWYLPFASEVRQKGSQQTSKVLLTKIEANVPLDDKSFERGGPSSPATPPTAGAGQAPQAQAPSPSAAPTAATRRTGAAIIADTEAISGLGARNIGSAKMSGRIAAVDAVHEGNRLTIYVGSASGGVWKSMNGGTTFKPVFDKEPVQSIGAIAIDPKSPRTVWVGTGESWTRNSVSVGDGIYRSTDGGDTWSNMGLKESERIVKIIVDPKDSNTVFACVPGKLWSDSTERGVYKTADGGKTWVKVLAGGNASTGCSMISMDPSDSKTLFAGMWDFRRKGWTFRSGGDGPESPSASGLFKSTDGGATWNELTSERTKGLPPKPWGRVAVTVAPSNAKVVYALIEAVPPHNALYRSSDGGLTWEMRDRSQNMIWRPFYFANLIVDPKNENRIYKPDLSLIVSNDGGASFSNISGGAHGDFHDVWVDAANSDHVITGDDGGLWYSYDAGNRWWKAENLPVSQFYHVSLDMDRPYNVYGGLQDNSSWVGASEYPGGITNSQWENMFGGDGFWMFVDPSDPDYIYAEAQGGYIGRVNRRTHETRDIKPLPGYKEA